MTDKKTLANSIFTCGVFSILLNVLGEMPSIADGGILAAIGLAMIVVFGFEK